MLKVDFFKRVLTEIANVKVTFRAETQIASVVLGKWLIDGHQLKLALRIRFPPYWVSWHLAELKANNRIKAGIVL